MSPQEMKPNSPIEAQEAPRDPCMHWRGTLRLWLQLQMRTYDLGQIGEESREGPHNSHGDWIFLGPHERVPEIPIVTQEEHLVSCCNLSKTKRFAPQCEMRPFSAVEF